jgi:hypothetical protein
MGWDGSDVYVYYDVRGGVTCIDLSHNFNGTPEEMVEHLHTHQDEGRFVPADVFADLAESAALMTESDR